jgi:hypothetical protein
VVLRPGYGSAGDKSPVLYQPTGPNSTLYWVGTDHPYGGGFVLDGAVGYRLLSFISIGLTVGWRTSSASSSEVTVFDLSRSALQIGLCGRGYLPLVGRLTDVDPWVSVGATYVYDKQTDSQQGGVPSAGPDAVSLTHHGVGIPLAIGVDYRILPFLAVGPSFQYEIVTGVRASCMISFSGNQPTGARQCSDAGAGTGVTAAKNYQVWSIGLELRLAL